jgi:endonuclease/exonuclease/phosphatase family metal-dependent hydrolase
VEIVSDTSITVSHTSLYLCIFAGDTNLMEDGEEMLSREQDLLLEHNLYDLAFYNTTSGKPPLVTWDGYANPHQIMHLERHRPDRVIYNRLAKTEVSVKASTQSDHYPLTVTVYPDTLIF